MPSIDQPNTPTRRQSAFAPSLIFKSPTRPSLRATSSHLPRRHGRKPLVVASLTLPAWARAHELERGLVSTSYESATVEQVAEVGHGFLRITVDTAVTCTAQQYRYPGQFLFLKPWGDEDGSIEPCCFTAAPGAGSVMDFFVPADSAVGEAARGGEMLEVSEVMGEGFATGMQGSEFRGMDEVVGVCADQFCSPVMLALSAERRPASLFVRAKEDGPFAEQVREWVEGGSDRIISYFEDETVLLEKFGGAIQKAASVAILLSGDAELCKEVEDVVSGHREGREVHIFAP